MAYLAVDKNGLEWVFKNKPEREETSMEWVTTESHHFQFVNLPQGTIAKIIGRPLTWDDEPVEIK